MAPSDRDVRMLIAFNRWCNQWVTEAPNEQPLRCDEYDLWVPYKTDVDDHYTINTFLARITERYGAGTKIRGILNWSHIAVKPRPSIIVAEPEPVVTEPTRMAGESRVDAVERNRRASFMAWHDRDVIEAPLHGLHSADAWTRYRTCCWDHFPQRVMVEMLQELHGPGVKMGASRLWGGLRLRDNGDKMS